MAARYGGCHGGAPIPSRSLGFVSQRTAGGPPTRSATQRLICCRPLVPLPAFPQVSMPFHSAFLRIRRLGFESLRARFPHLTSGAKQVPSRHVRIRELVTLVIGPGGGSRRPIGVRIRRLLVDCKTATECPMLRMGLVGSGRIRGSSWAECPAFVGFAGRPLVGAVGGAERSEESMKRPQAVRVCLGSSSMAQRAVVAMCPLSNASRRAAPTSRSKSVQV